MKPFVAQLVRAAATNPTKVALHYGRQCMTYAELDAMSRRMASALLRLGIREEDRVAIWMPNVPAFVVLLLACMRIGAVAVTVNTRFRSSEVGDILFRTGAKALMLWPGFHAIAFLDIAADIERPALEKLKTVIVYAEDDAPLGGLPFPGAAVVRYAELLQGDGQHPEPNGDGGVTFTTSGTTQAPKFVRHGQTGSARHGLAVARAFGYDAVDAKVLIAVPLCGIFGYTQFVGAIAAGATIELLPVMDVDAIVDALRAGVTHMNGTDTLFRRVLAAVPQTAPFPRLMPTVLAPFDYPPVETVVLAESRGLVLLGAYGMTEIFAMFSRQCPDMPAHERAKGGGYPTSSEVTIRVRDPDSGLLLPCGSVGELEVRGPSTMVGYLDNPEATAAAFTDDGFLRTGDIGSCASDGRILYEARRIEMARLGGFLVNPVEIESCLLRHATVDFAQAVVVPTADGNKAVGFVILKPGALLDEASIRELCGHSMARYKVPARIIALPVFPTTDGVNGVKVQRARLRDLAASVLND